MMTNLLRSLVLTLLILVPTAVNAAIVEVSAQRVCAQQGVASSLQLVLPSNVSTGDFILVSGSTLGNGSTPASIAVTDTRSTSYSELTASGGLTWQMSLIGYGFAPSAGANTITITPSLDAYISACATVFTGVNALDVDGASSNGSGTSPADSITTVATNALVVGVVSRDTFTGNTIAPGAGFTQVGEFEDDTVNISTSVIFKIDDGAVTVDWTLGASANWTAQTASFEPFVGSAGGRKRIFIVH